MKKVYLCEMCGEQHEFKTAAKSCEESHIKAREGEIVNESHDIPSMTPRPYPFPRAICVRYPGGHSVWYEVKSSQSPKRHDDRLSRIASAKPKDCE